MAAWRAANGKFRFLIIAGLIATIALAGFGSDHIPVRNLALADTHRVVSITADGATRIVTTDATTVGDVLARAGVALSQSDLVEPSASTVIPVGFFNINVFRSQLYEVVDGSHVFVARSAQQSPRLVAADAGLNLYPEDNAKIEIVNNFVSDPLVGERLVIDRAIPVQIKVDGSVSTVRSHLATVGALLAAKSISLGEKDTVSPEPSYGLVPGLSVSVTRIADVVVTKTEVIAKTTKTISDPNQPKGTSTVQVVGADGQRQVTYRIHYQNGVEVGREQLQITGVVDPIARVVIEGTKVIFAGSVEYWRPYVIAAATSHGINPNLELAIMSCESHGNAGASNGTHFGLFQYSTATWQSYGNSPDTIFDGPTQIEVTAGRLSAPNPTYPWLASQSCWAGSY